MRRPARFAAIAWFVATLCSAGWDVLPSPVQAAGDAGTIAASSRFEVSGQVGAPKTFELADLQAEPTTTETVYFNTGKGPVSATFTGVLLWTLLQELDLETDPAVRNDILRRVIVVTGTDGYRVALSAGELDPKFGGELAIVAYLQDGEPLGENGGFARLIVPGDKAGGRNVASIAKIEVR